MKRFHPAILAVMIIAAATVSNVAVAQEHYAHEHIVHALPHDRVVIDHHGDHFYFSRGYWYHGHGPAFIAVAPPFGVRLSVLPFGYRTVVAAGLTYYVLNDIWYQQMSGGYVVVAPPGTTAVVAPPVVAAPPVVVPPSPPMPASNQDFFAYPRNGQGEKQQAQDRYECHVWAKQQTGFDPTLPLGGVAAGTTAQKHADYRRAITACLEGRGYTVR